MGTFEFWFGQGQICKNEEYMIFDWLMTDDKKGYPACIGTTRRIPGVKIWKLNST